jgi:xanthine dehydrogenase YagS FAD-binding subunit
MINFEYFRSSTTSSAIDARIKHKEAQFIASSTILVDLMKKGIVNPQRLIDINGFR